MICDRCEREIRPDEPAWKFHLTLMADPIQGMQEYAGFSKKNLDDRLDALIRRIELIPKDMLEAQVFQEFSFVICAQCRGIVAANPLQQPLG